MCNAHVYRIGLYPGCNSSIYCPLVYTSMDRGAFTMTCLQRIAEEVAGLVLLHL